MTEVAVQKLDVHNTKEVLVGAFKFAKVIKEAKANNGKFDVMDLPLAMQLIPVLGPMIEDADKVPAELKDIDNAEVAEVLALVAAEVGGVVSKAELLVQINAGLEAIHAIVKFVKTL